MTKQKTNEIQVEASPLTEEDERLEKLFDEMESGSLETLENAARQIITLATALLAAFFGLLAFKDVPPYLGFMEIKLIGALSLVGFLLALFQALQAISPVQYSFPHASLTAKRQVMNKMLERKQVSVMRASWAFGIGTFLMFLAALDILIFRI